MIQDQPLFPTQEDLATWSEEFQKSHKMPFATSVGEPFYEDGKLIAVRWLNYNMQKNFVFCSAIMHYKKVEAINVIGDILLTSRDCENLDEDYFPSVPNNPEHRNAMLLRSIRTNRKNLLVMFYPTEECLSENGPESLVDASCRNAMISHLCLNPGEINTEGMYEHLPKLAYMPNGKVMTPEKWNQRFFSGDYAGLPICVDKIPPLLWGAPIPENRIIQNSSNIELGQYLQKTT